MQFKDETWGRKPEGSRLLRVAVLFVPAARWLAKRSGRVVAPASLGLALVLFASSALGSRVEVAAGGPCDAPIVNPIPCENSKPGTPDEWRGGYIGNPSIRGFATRMSVDQGETLRFKVKTDATSYLIHIYRLGYYGGDGARKVAVVSPSVPLPQSQPACLTVAATGLTDCGNWAESASWPVPADAVSGIYIARLERPDGRDSQIIFVVRDDDGGSDLLVQTSDTTWTAYNDYGGNSLYTGQPAGRAFKVSYNRPLEIAELSYLFNGEYPMVRWLERNGYNVSYTSGVDTASRGAEILEHKAFLSVGHDEYWSSEQRANVEAARAAGVNLAFFSGNEMFWKTRWENSIDGTGTPYRTLVSYKETHAGAKIDPDPAWTGTWRDPRFSPPSDGGRPENAVTGTMFSVNTYREDPMHVPAAYGNLRFWRNTSVANLQPGETAVLPAGVLGHEWDSDVDNGFRPAGLMRLSSTTHSVGTLILDFGSTYGAGEATHNLTLYRAPSGALVFGAGTVQWAWGLDEDHVFPGTPTDARMQQATVNLFADMGAQAGTLQPDLVPATKSTDAVAPTSTIISPAIGASFQNGDVVTISGTAADTGGGVVGGVEVSVDGGATWHPATGRAAWTYSWKVGGYGLVTLRARAVDDSGNLEVPLSSVAVNVVCPCSLWSTGTTPAIPAAADAGAIEVGVKFRADAAGSITALRFYKGPGNTGTHVGSLWTDTGELLSRATFSAESASGWQTVNFATPVEISANSPYVASYHAPNGNYSLDRNYFGAAYDNAPLHAPASGASSGNGVFAYSANPTFPAGFFQASNYWVDVVFEPAPPDDTPPNVTSVTPSAGATGFGTTSDVTATFSETMTAGSINASTFALRTGAGALVPATVSYDGSTRTATLDPTDPLAATSTYTATVTGGSSGVKDKAGNPLAANETWSFTTGTGPVCPCKLFSTGTIPTTPSVTEGTPIELGVKFRADRDGSITALRFYKGPGNGGTHVGSLWGESGQLLARATFTGESTTGWQQVSFATPVAITEDTAYVASYHAPTGGYSLNRSFFDVPYDNSPLHVPASASIAGGNGVYLYSAVPAFPTGTFQSSNYWVDVLFTPAPPDVTPPTVNSASPTAGSTGFSTTGDVTATFNEAMSAASITGSAFTLRNSAGDQVAATVSYDAATRTATLDPTGPLAPTATLTATVRGGSAGVKDKAGNPLAADYSWSFTTAIGPTCPCSLWNATRTPGTPSSGDARSVELGVKFRADLDGWVTGLRFYKGTGNSGTHVGSLWTASGELLSRATFTGETETGWQEVVLASPVAVTANTLYVASYHAPVGNFAVDRSYFESSYDKDPLHAPSSVSLVGGNGVFSYNATPTFPDLTFQASNYWVDVVFLAAPPDTTPPTVTSESPTGGATGVGTTTNVDVTFSETMEAGSINGSTVTLRDASNTLVPSTVTYNAATRTATLDPAAPLAAASTYTATIVGGSSGVKDKSGNALAGDHSWSFTVAGGPVCPCSLWSTTRIPATLSSGDPNALEVGVKFTSDVDGSITGVRFYKGPGNTGTHVGSLWTDGGLLLGRATFSAESSSGWQSVTFDSPVAITANTTYVASYHAPNGNFSVDSGYFGSAYDNTPLHAPSSATSGGNGVYVYSGAPAFPTGTFQAGNYWVDVLFTPAPPDTTPPTVDSVSPSAGATGVSTTTDVTATFSEPMTASSISGSTFTLRDAANALVPASVTYDAGTRTATLDPTGPLAPNSTYTATVAGGGSGVKDKAGNSLAVDRTWAFTTGAGPSCPCSLWSLVTTPATASSGDPAALEVGVKFRADSNGSITGLRFYKGSGNTGTHVGSLWTDTGLLLGRATFGGESSSGWQSVTFASPVAVTANTTYLASYHAPNGNFAVNSGYFGSQYDSAPLHAPASGAVGGNGVYLYTATPAFPTASYAASNYWVDVLFTPTGG